MILSVVIPSRNKCDLLERTLTVLRGQEVGGDPWEIVVVDDGSTDGTAAMLERVAAAESRLRVVTAPVNVGRAAARNLGWRAATGAWVLFLDDDILAPPGLLRAHLDVLHEDPDRGTIGPAVTDPAIVDAPHFHYIDTRGVAKLPPGPAPGKYLVTQNAAAPREALERIGGFDEEFSAYGFEDMDLGFRLEDAGVRFRVVPQPVPLHIHHHTLDAYLEKKRICGRSSLRQIAALHPDRLAEMRLDLVVDASGTTPGARVRLLRRCLRGWPGRLALATVGRWPGGARGPWLRGLYFRLMDAAVLTAYVLGLAEAPPEGANATQ